MREVPLYAHRSFAPFQGSGGGVQGSGGLVYTWKHPPRSSPTNLPFAPFEGPHRVTSFMGNSNFLGPYNPLVCYSLSKEFRVIFDP